MKAILIPGLTNSSRGVSTFFDTHPEGGLIAKENVVDLVYVKIYNGETLTRERVVDSYFDFKDSRSKKLYILKVSRVFYQDMGIKNYADLVVNRSVTYGNLIPEDCKDMTVIHEL